MITIQSTPAYAGVAISGDLQDFEALHRAMHDVVGAEGELPYYRGERLRILSVCYDLRHAMMGDREVEFVESGMDRDKMKRLSLMAPEKNVYYKCYVYWPEMLFVQMALNDFVSIFAKQISKKKYDVMNSKEVIWNETITTIRSFQAAVASCIRETVPETSVNRVMNLLYKDYSFFGGYMTQYLDELNIKFLKLAPEKRQKQLPIMAKRLSEFGDDYQKLRVEIQTIARGQGVDPEQIRLLEDYPEEVEW